MALAGDGASRVRLPFGAPPSWRWYWGPSPLKNRGKFHSCNANSNHPECNTLFIIDCLVFRRPTSVPQCAVVASRTGKPSSIVWFWNHRPSMRLVALQPRRTAPGNPPTTHQPRLVSHLHDMRALSCPPPPVCAFGGLLGIRSFLYNRLGSSDFIIICLINFGTNYCERWKRGVGGLELRAWSALADCPKCCRCNAPANPSLRKWLLMHLCNWLSG